MTMTRRLPFILAAIAAATTVAPPCVHAQEPDTLAHGDLLIARISENTDTALARRTLGAPRHVDRPAQIGTSGYSIVNWSYPGIKMSFQEGRLWAVSISDTAIVTARGVRVGDPESRVRLVYGRPLAQGTTYLLYGMSGGYGGTLGIIFSLTNGRVKEITIGHVISRD